MAFCSLQENLVRYGRKLLDTATKTEIEAAKTASKKDIQKKLKPLVIW